MFILLKIPFCVVITFNNFTPSCSIVFFLIFLSLGVISTILHTYRVLQDLPVSLPKFQPNSREGTYLFGDFHVLITLYLSILCYTLDNLKVFRPIQ